MSLCGVFGVSLGYLLGESERHLVAGEVTLLSAWRALEAPDRELLLSLAASIRKRALSPTEPGAGTPNDAQT